MSEKINNIVINDEYLNKIRSFVAIHPDETFWYVPTAYRDLPDDLKPKFHLKPISGEQILRFGDSMRGEVAIEDGKAEIKIRNGEYIISVVKFGLFGWENYYDLRGNIIPYQNNINPLPRELLEELSNAITERSKLTDEEILGLK